MNRRNEFKKWLIDTMKASSNANYTTICIEVHSYSKTPEFEKQYHRWRKKFIKQNRINMPKHISEILEKNYDAN